MKTVLRNSKGEITWVHGYHNVYFTPDAHKILTETLVTIPMVEKTYGNPNYLISTIVNDNINPLAVKSRILTEVGLISNSDKKFI